MDELFLRLMLPLVLTLLTIVILLEFGVIVTGLVGFLIFIGWLVLVNGGFFIASDDFSLFD